MQLSIYTQREAAAVIMALLYEHEASSIYVDLRAACGMVIDCNVANMWDISHAMRHMTFADVKAEYSKDWDSGLISAKFIKK